MIETPRLRLLPWNEDDWRDFAPIARDPEVMRYITGGEPWPDERVQEFVAKQRLLYETKGFCRWRLELKETGETAGFCGAGNIHGFDEYEMGWWIAYRHWGKGLATEAASAAIHDLFTRIGMDRIVSVIAVGNDASVAVARKLGYHYVRDGVLHGFDVRVYEKLRDDQSTNTLS